MVNRVECSTVMRSKLIRVEGLPSSEDRKMLSKVTSREISVEWHCL